MKEIKVLGTGCCNKCGTTAALIEEVAKARGVAVSLLRIRASCGREQRRAGSQA